MKKSILALLLAAGVAQAGQFDGAYHCSLSGYTFFQMVSSKADGSMLVVVACPGDPETCVVGGYALGTISGAQFMGIDATGDQSVISFTPLGFTTPTFITTNGKQSTVTMACTKVW